MEVTNNSTIDSVIDFANVKFGMEVTRDQIVEQLKDLSFSETLKLLNVMKADDNDAFSEIIDLSAFSEAVHHDGEDNLASLKIIDIAKEKTKRHTLPRIDTEKYQERDGLEGPIATRSGKTVYYDPKEGKYYDPDTDMYIADEDMIALTRGPSFEGKDDVDPFSKEGWAKYKEYKTGSKTGDMMDKEDKERGNKRYGKYEDGVWHSHSTSDPKKWQELIAKGYTLVEDDPTMTPATLRIKKLAGLKEGPGAVYTTDAGPNGEMSSPTMHGLLDQIEDYYHYMTGNDNLDVQISDDHVYIGNEKFDIYKDGENLGSDLYNELEREDISKGKGPYQHKLSGDDLEKSKTMTPDQIKVLAGIKEEKVVEGPDYRLQAQRETMNLSDQAIVELVASLYEKLDKLGHREETDAEYFDDLYKQYPNNESVKEDEKPRQDAWGPRGREFEELVNSYWDSLPTNMRDEIIKFYDGADNLNELGYGSSTTAQPSRATINKQNSNVANRRYNITVQDQNRDAKVANKTVAGSNIQATGQGAARTGMDNPDDIERANNAYQSNANAEQANVNAQEIERLKQLALGG